MTTTQIRTPSGSLSGATMQCLVVLLHGLKPAKQCKTAVAAPFPLNFTASRRCLVRFRLSDFFFKLGSFLVLAGAGLTGYGCSCPCTGSAFGPCAAPADVPGHACYVKVAYVPMACCFTTPF